MGNNDINQPHHRLFESPDTSTPKAKPPKQQSDEFLKLPKNEMYIALVILGWSVGIILLLFVIFAVIVAFSQPYNSDSIKSILLNHNYITIGSIILIPLGCFLTWVGVLKAKQYIMPSHSALKLTGYAAIVYFLLYTQQISNPTTIMILLIWLCAYYYFVNKEIKLVKSRKTANI